MKKIWNSIKSPRVQQGLWQTPTYRDFQVMLYGYGRYAQLAFDIATRHGEIITPTESQLILANPAEDYTSSPNCTMSATYEFRQYNHYPLLVAAWKNSLGSWGILVTRDRPNSPQTDLKLSYTQRNNGSKPVCGYSSGMDWRYDLLALRDSLALKRQACNTRSWDMNF